MLNQVKPKKHRGVTPGVYRVKTSVAGSGENNGVAEFGLKRQVASELIQNLFRSELEPTQNWNSGESKREQRTIGSQVACVISQLSFA